MQSEIDAFLRIDATIVAAVQQGDQALAQSFVLGPGRLTVGYLDDDAESLANFAREGQPATVSVPGDGAPRVGAVAQSWRRRHCGGRLPVAVVIARTIRRPLAKLEAAARRAANGDLDVIVESKSNDETGRLISAFNTMVTGLRQSVGLGMFDTELRAACSTWPTPRMARSGSSATP